MRRFHGQLLQWARASSEMASSWDSYAHSAALRLAEQCQSAGNWLEFSGVISRIGRSVVADWMHSAVSSDPAGLSRNEERLSSFAAIRDWDSIDLTETVASDIPFDIYQLRGAISASCLKIAVSHSYIECKWGRYRQLNSSANIRICMLDRK